MQRQLRSNYTAIVTRRMCVRRVVFSLERAKQRDANREPYFRERFYSWDMYDALAKLRRSASLFNIYALRGLLFFVYVKRFGA